MFYGYNQRNMKKKEENVKILEETYFFLHDLKYPKEIRIYCKKYYYVDIR